MTDGARVRQPAKRLVHAIVVAGAMLLAGCETVVPRGPTAPGRRPPPPRQQPVQIEPGIPTDTERHRVALLVPLSGPNAGVGQSLANATQMALLDSNNQRIRITTYDTNLGAAAAAQRAIAEGNRLILGPLLGDDVRAVTPLAHRSGVPVVAFSNDSSAAGQGAYLMGYAPTQSIARVVDYAKGQGITSFAGLVPNGTYGERASTAFLRSVESAGGQVTSLQTYQRVPGSITTAIAKMAKDSPYQAVLIADNANTASSAVPVLRRMGAGSAHVLGTELWNTDNSIASKAALNGAWYAAVSNGLYRQYAAKYRARFGSAPFRLSSLGYDAVLLTIRISADWRVGTPFPERRLTDAGGFAGIDGAFRFGRDGVAERALEVEEIRGGSVVTVSPAPRGFE